MQRLAGSSDKGRRENNSKYILKLSPSSEIRKQSNCLSKIITTSFPYPGFLFSGADPYKDFNFFIFFKKMKEFVHWRQKRTMTPDPTVCVFLSFKGENLQKMKEILLSGVFQGSKYTQSALWIHGCRNIGLTILQCFI